MQVALVATISSTVENLANKVARLGGTPLSEDTQAELTKRVTNNISVLDVMSGKKAFQQLLALNIVEESNKLHKENLE